MAVNPNLALQFNKALGRTSEPKKARASGTVVAVSADSDNKIKNATISTGGGLIGLPVPYGINVYTGMNVAIINDGTPSNAQWRLAGTTSLPGGIQGGSIINHDGNTFAMFDSIWVRNDGVIIVGGDIDIDGNPTGPRVESNQCGYFGFDQYDRQSLAIYAAACDGRFAGDVLLGPEEAARIEILPNDGTVSVTYNSEQALEFGPDGNFIRKPMTVGNPVGARINLGEIEDKATFVLRDKHGVAKMVARTDDTNDVYVHIGNPPPEDNSMWFDSADGRLNVNGHVTMQSMDVRGRATFASTGEFMIVDPDDPGRFGVITPRGQYAYTTDSLGVTHLIRVDAWGPLVLEDVLGSGTWRTWVGGSQVFGDPRYRHFRIERGAAARAGMFNGEIPVSYMDQTGKGIFTGDIYASGGEFTGDVTITTGSLITDTVLLDNSGITVDALLGKYNGGGIVWINETDSTEYLSIGTQVDFGVVVSNNINSATVDLSISSDENVYIRAGSGKNVLISNGAKFDDTGHLTFTGDAKPWDDLRVEPVSRSTGVNVPAFEKWFDDAGLAIVTASGTSRGTWLYSFDDVVAESEKELFFNVQYSHAWDGGTAYVHVHWVGSHADTTATPRWGMEYNFKEPGATFGATTTIYAIGNHVNDANLVAGKHYITSFAAITPDSTQDGLSSVMTCRIFRNSSNAADTYDVSGNKCGLLYVDAHYQLARIGSNDEYTA